MINLYEFVEKLDSYYYPEINWDAFYSPKFQRRNFATRYHLIYPSLVYFLLLRKGQQNQDISIDEKKIHQILGNILESLQDERVWNYWFNEVKETSHPLVRANLTFVGRLATFLGLYTKFLNLSPDIIIAEKRFNHKDLSKIIYNQAQESSCCSVACFNGKNMIPCNLHLLLNNVLVDQLYQKQFTEMNHIWLDRFFEKSVTSDHDILYSSISGSCEPDSNKNAKGYDAWSLFLLSILVPERTRKLFLQWDKITYHEDDAYVEVHEDESKNEKSSTALSTAWIYCLTKELGINELSTKLELYLQRQQNNTELQLNPLVLGLFTLGRIIDQGDLRELIFN